MNKAELVESVAKKLGTSKKASEDALNAVTSSITEALKKGDKVQLVGFGSFDVRKRKARTGRNPQTGAAVKIPASKTAVFKAGKGLKAAL